MANLDSDDLRWRRLLELLSPVHDQALATARRLSRSSDDGDDLFQEAVLRAHAKLDSLRDESRFRAWFYAVLLSRHRSRARRHFWNRFLPLEEEVASGREPAGDDGSLWEERRAGAKRMSRALATLPAVQREAIVLCDISCFSIDEIASMQSVSASAVKSRLSRGRERLRKYYYRLGAFSRATSPVNEEDRDEDLPIRCARSSG